MKAWIAKIFDESGVGYTEPIDYVTATMLVALGSAGGLRAELLPVTRNLISGVVAELEAGVLVARVINIRIGNPCKCEACVAKGSQIREETIRVAMPPGAEKKQAGLAVIASEEMPAQVAAIAPLVSAASLPPIVGGFPLLDSEPVHVKIAGGCDDETLPLDLQPPLPQEVATCTPSPSVAAQPRPMEVTPLLVVQPLLSPLVVVQGLSLSLGWLDRFLAWALNCLRGEAVRP